MIYHYAIVTCLHSSRSTESTVDWLVGLLLDEPVSRIGGRNADRYYNSIIITNYYC